MFHTDNISFNSVGYILIFLQVTNSFWQCTVSVFSLMTPANPLDSFVHRTTLTANISPLSRKLSKRRLPFPTWHWQAYARQPTSLRSLPARKNYFKIRRTWWKLTFDHKFLLGIYFYSWGIRGSLRGPKQCPTFQTWEVRNVISQKEIVCALQPSHLEEH